MKRLFEMHECIYRFFALGSGSDCVADTVSPERRCGQTADGSGKVPKSRHVPLYRVWNEPNLQVINRNAHVLKCADKARDRSLKRSPAAKDAAVNSQQARPGL